jgi:hypothetical protein
LIKHLKGKGVLAHRSVTIADIPFFKPDVPVTTDAQVDAAVAHLVRLKAAKPRAQKTLMGTLHALFKKELTKEQLAALFGSLCKRGVVKIEGTKVSYDLPTVPNHALHRTFNQRRFACWFRAGEGSRSALPDHDRLSR